MLRRVSLAAEQMKSGNYTQRVTPPKGKDELERLAVTFNAMADTIEADVNELRHQEQWRRELLANIAHDLATPLTAIQGFGEALADNVITDPEARQETAQLIGREVQRLRRLVGEMQQMTSLESGRIQLELAPLDIHALVDETLAVIKPEQPQTKPPASESPTLQKKFLPPKIYYQDATRSGCGTSAAAPSIAASPSSGASTTTSVTS